MAQEDIQEEIVICWDSSNSMEDNQIISIKDYFPYFIILWCVLHTVGKFIAYVIP